MRISDWSSDVCSSDLCLVSAALPRRERQTRLYRDVLEAAGDRPVVFRTLDIGGDKALPYLREADEIGRAHVRTPVTNAHLVCRLLLEKKKKLQQCYIFRYTPLPIPKQRPIINSPQQYQNTVVSYFHI